MWMMQAENHVAFWLMSTENKIPIIIKISIYFLYLTTFKTYQSQYRSKYHIYTQHLTEGKTFEFFAISNIRELFCLSGSSSK